MYSQYFKGKKDNDLRWENSILEMVLKPQQLHVGRINLMHSSSLFNGLS